MGVSIVLHIMYESIHETLFYSVKLRIPITDNEFAVIVVIGNVVE